MRFQQKRRHGFTLIELLVVIAIIAILAAILFPVFAKAREKARQTTCSSNEKQIALAILQYVQDFDEKFPTVTIPITASGVTPAVVYWWPYEVYPYVKSAQVFSCPDDAGINNIAGSVAQTTGDYYDRESYGMNIALNTPPTGLAFVGAGIGESGIALAQLNYPSDCCLIAETCLQTNTGQGFGWNSTSYSSPMSPLSDQSGWPQLWYSASTATPTPSDSPGNNLAFATPIARHTGSAEVAFTDGHVKNISYSALYSPPVGTLAANYKLWHPSTN